MIGSLLLLLDIDGTLCPAGAGPAVEMRHLSIGAGAVSFRADLPEVLAELAALYELAWATAWQDNANLLLAPALGLPTLPVVRFTDPADEVGSRYTGRTWKLPSVQGFEADRPLAWIDDDLHGDAHSWAAARRIPTKLLSTDPSRGIVDREVRSLLAFARALSAGGRKSAEGLAERTPAVGLSTRVPRCQVRSLSHGGGEGIRSQIPDGHCGFRAYLGRTPAKAAGVIAAVAPANPDSRCVW